jgi:hypothetical protein
MNPRRVLPYLAFFLVMAGVYLGQEWYQGRQTTREQEAKKLFQIKEAEVSEIAVIKGKEEIRLVKQDQEWRLTRPLQAKADQDAVKSVLTTLSHLQKIRDLGTREDLKTFGLDHPEVRVEFTVQDKSHRLAIGQPAPGETQFYYVLKDQDPQVLLISSGDKNSLDRPLSSLRDKSLLAFNPKEVKAVKFTTGQTAIHLERTGSETWRWLGREPTPVRADRVEGLLRQMEQAKIKEFIPDAAKDLKSYGLAPQPQLEITLVTDKGQETVEVGKQAPAGIYARVKSKGEVVALNPAAAENWLKTPSQLEDRRLWTGSFSQPHKVVWGPPEKLWTAIKEQESFKLTGPEQQEVRQPAVRVESALSKLGQLEYQKPLTAVTGKQETFRLEIYDGANQLLFHLEEWGKPGTAQVEVRTRMGDKTALYAVPVKEFQALQEDLNRLAALPPKK